MFSHKSSNIPSLYIQNEGEESTKIVLQLTRAEQKFVIRITGGCGYMSPDDAKGLYNLFAEAFNGFKGAMLFGGTRMIKKDNTSSIVPGITEIPPLIEKKEDVVILGVVPKTSDLELSVKYGLVVSVDNKQQYITVVHPDQDMCLIVQSSVDKTSCWETEFEECIRITSNLRDFADWKSLLISYNGGKVTEKEILKTAKLGWPVLLIKGSGRKTDEYANNQEFLNAYPNVVVAQKEVSSIRKQLIKAGALPCEPLRLIGEELAIQ